MSYDSDSAFTDAQTGSQRGRRVRDARKNEHQVCARRRAGEAAGLEQAAGVTFLTHPPLAAEQLSPRRGTLRSFANRERSWGPVSASGYSLRA
jgi:hypothetical protein